METFAVDRSLYEMGENDLKDIWDPDFDSPMHDTFATESDWTALLDHQMVILNDRMMTDAIQSPRITSEHSYSLVTNDELSDSALDGTRLDLDQDLESECFPAIPMTTATGGHSEIFIKQEPVSAPNSPQPISSPPPQKLSTTSTSSSLGAQSLLKQPTIILATRPSSQRCVYVPKVNIKMESISSGFTLPPTPPSSTSSDSEGSLSPVHSQQPSSPSMLISSSGASVSTRRPSSLGSMGARSNHSNTPLISSQPKGATGVLMLTEEEKRTLVAEGYPIPSKLPLTKAEEKSLKKIRRKIKNKISAQESRRKKKEYMDSLEKKVEALHSENTEYKRKVDSLENNNKTLLSQLHKLQALVGQTPNRIARNISTQTSLMVLVLSFMLSFGLWGSSFSLISSSFPGIQLNSLDRPVFHPTANNKISRMNRDPYLTPNKRSRFLFSRFEENDYDNDDEVICKDFPVSDSDGFSTPEFFDIANPNVRNLIDDHPRNQMVNEIDVASIDIMLDTFFANSYTVKMTIEAMLVANLTAVLQTPLNASMKPYM